MSLSLIYSSENILLNPTYIIFKLFEKKTVWLELLDDGLPIVN